LSSRLALIRVDVRVSGFYGYLYTSRLVKTTLIRACSKLEEHFKPTKGPVPKLLHITPLYRRANGGVECVYSYAECRGRWGVVKCRGEPSVVELSGDYYFYIGLHESVVRSVDVISSLLNYAECFEFIKQRVCVELRGLDVINPASLARELASRVISARGVKVVFSSPTLLRDPLKTVRKQKTFLPTPLVVFATPIYVRLIATSSCRRGVFRRELLRVHRLFNETYSALGSVRVKWVYYTDRPIPALTGYVNYRLDENYLNYLESRGADIAEWLGEIFAYALTLGVGAGRAAGFGHVELKPLKTPSGGGGGQGELGA